jgi:hypothetical protein
LLPDSDEALTLEVIEPDLDNSPVVQEMHDFRTAQNLPHVFRPHLTFFFSLILPALDGTIFSVSKFQNWIPARTLQSDIELFSGGKIPSLSRRRFPRPPDEMFFQGLETSTFKSVSARLEA